MIKALAILTALLATSEAKCNAQHAAQMEKSAKLSQSDTRLATGSGDATDLDGGDQLSRSRVPFDYATDDDMAFDIRAPSSALEEPLDRRELPLKQTKGSVAASGKDTTVRPSLQHDSNRTGDEVDQTITNSIANRLDADKDTRQYVKPQFVPKGSEVDIGEHTQAGTTFESYMLSCDHCVSFCKQNLLAAFSA
jgi:hypothetical protein